MSNLIKIYYTYNKNYNYASLSVFEELAKNVIIIVCFEYS